MRTVDQVGRAEPAGERDFLARHAEAAQPPRAEVADGHLPAVDAHAKVAGQPVLFADEFLVERADLPRDLQRRAACRASVVGHGQRRAEKHPHALAVAGGERAALFHERLDGGVEEAVGHRDILGRFERLHQRGMIEDLANHEGQFFQLAVVAQFRAAVDERAHLAARHPRTEGRVHPALPLAGLAVGINESGGERHDRCRRGQERREVEPEKRRQRRQGEHLRQGEDGDEDFELRAVDVDGRPGDAQRQRDESEMLDPGMVERMTRQAEPPRNRRVQGPEQARRVDERQHEAGLHAEEQGELEGAGHGYRITEENRKTQRPKRVSPADGALRAALVPPAAQPPERLDACDVSGSNAARRASSTGPTKAANGSNRRRTCFP